MPIYQYTVRDQTGETRIGTTMALTEMEVRGRLQAEGFHIVSTQRQADDDRPVQMFQYVVRDGEGEMRRGTLSGRSEEGIAAVLKGAGYTVVKISPAVKAWIGNSDGDAYRGYVATAEEAPPLASQEQQIARLKRSNRLLLAVVLGLFTLICTLMFLLLCRK